MSGPIQDKSNDVPNTSLLIMTQGKQSCVTKANVFSSVDGVVSAKTDTEDFWSPNSIGVIDKVKSVDDTAAMKHFKDTVCFVDGRYRVQWP